MERHAQRAPRLADVLRDRRAQILQTWEERVRKLRAAADVSPPALIDHIPAFLNDLVAQLEAGEDTASARFPRLHALSRLELGYDLKTVVGEYGMLRACLVELAVDETPALWHATELPLLHAVIDDAISESVDIYAWERERTLRGLVEREHAARMSAETHEQRFRTLVDALAQVVFVCAPDGALVESPGWVAFTGQPWSEARGWGFLSAVHPDERDAAEENWRASAAAGEPFRCENRVRARDGGYRLVAARAVPLRGAGGEIQEWVSALSDISEVRASEEALRKSEQVTTAIFDSVHEGIVFQDEHGVIQRLNRSAERLLGAAETELRGLTTPLLRFGYLREDGSPFPPEEHPAAEALRTGEPQLGVRLGLRLEDGSLTWLNINSQPVPRPGRGGSAGVVSSFFDLSAQRRSEEQRAELAAEVERQHAQLETVLALLPVGVILRDARTLAVLLVNEAARRIYGRYVETIGAPHEYAQAPLQDAHGRPVPHDALPLVRTLRGAVVERQLLRVPLDPERIVEVATAPIRDRLGQISAAVDTLVDVTASQQTELELRSALGFRDRILGVLSHDLRNPLGVIKMSAGVLMRAGDLNERHLRGLARIDGNADRITRLVHDLLDYTRARQGAGIPIVPRPANLHDLCQQVIESMEVLHPGRSFRFLVSGNARGEWDPDRVLQAVGNLVGNAIQYSPEGTPVTLLLRDEREIVELTVHNEGEPIPPALLSELFEPFRSTGGTHKDGERGLGLGLYIVRELVEAHGGTVAAYSDRESGTRFVVRWPRK